MTNVFWFYENFKADTIHFFIIQKKSREESSGAGSGIEIMVNEPYENGPGGNGQYTRKIYHVGSHLPGWIKGKDQQCSHPLKFKLIDFVNIKLRSSAKECING